MGLDTVYLDKLKTDIGCKYHSLFWEELGKGYL